MAGRHMHYLRRSTVVAERAAVGDLCHISMVGPFHWADHGDPPGGVGLSVGGGGRGERTDL